MITVIFVVPSTAITGSFDSSYDSDKDCNHPLFPLSYGNIDSGLMFNALDIDAFGNMFVVGWAKLYVTFSPEGPSPINGFITAMNGRG